METVSGAVRVCAACVCVSEKRAPVSSPVHAGLPLSLCCLSCQGVRVFCLQSTYLLHLNTHSYCAVANTKYDCR